MSNVLAKLTFIFMCFLFTNIGIAHADDEGPNLSYTKTNPHDEVSTAIDNLTAWAEGELAEHEMEGLFGAYPDEQKLIRQTIDLAKQLKQQADRAKNQGDQLKARTFYYSAEATARYAANMPHMLEARLAHTN